MFDWLRKWYVPRAEHQRLMHDYSLEIAQLRVRIRHLEAQQPLDEMCWLAAFEVCEELPDVKNETNVQNVIRVDFRRRFQA